MCVADRRYRVKSLEPYSSMETAPTAWSCAWPTDAIALKAWKASGEVILHDDQGQSVYLMRNGIKLTDKAGGEVILHDDQGQSVYLMRNGIKLTDKAGSTVVLQGDGSGVMTFNAGLTINANSKVVGTLEVTQNITCQASITAAQDVGDQRGTKTMAGMRAVFNAHTHSGTDSHGDSFTSKPPNSTQ